MKRLLFLLLLLLLLLVLLFLLLFHLWILLQATAVQHALHHVMEKLDMLQ